MSRFEGETGPQDLPEFLHDKDTFSRSMVTDDATFIPVSDLSAGEKSLPATFQQAESCTEIPRKSSDTVDYPGRSVLYSSQFRPLNRKISTHL